MPTSFCLRALSLTGTEVWAKTVGAKDDEAMARVRIRTMTFLALIGCNYLSKLYHWLTWRFGYLGTIHLLFLHSGPASEWRHKFLSGRRKIPQWFSWLGRFENNYLRFPNDF